MAGDEPRRLSGDRDGCSTWPPPVLHVVGPHVAVSTAPGPERAHITRVGTEVEWCGACHHDDGAPLSRTVTFLVRGVNVTVPVAELITPDEDAAMSLVNEGSSKST